MDIKLIAVDMDGTLLDDRKRLPEGFFETVERLAARGVRTVIASGRQYYNLLKRFEPIRDRLIFLCENGALVFERDENLFRRAIPPDLLKKVLRSVSRIPDAKPVVSCVRTAYLADPGPEAERNIAQYFERRTIVADPLEAALAHDSAVKTAVYVAGAAAKFHPALKDEFGADLAVVLAGEDWLDFMAPDVSKGAAIRFLQRRLGLAPEQCMAFGDYMNDYEMLQSVHYGYAMRNGHPDLVASARFVAPPNTENGVMRTIAACFPDCVVGV